MAEGSAFIALGANLGDPVAQVRRALDELARLPATRLEVYSALYRSQAEGYTAQPDFINAVARVRTALSPRALLAELLALETRHGRHRTFKNAPRTLDLDLLLYDDLSLHEPGLTLPHPRMCERLFVLRPLQEIAAEHVIPGRGSVAACLSALLAAGHVVAPERLPHDGLNIP